jgi:transcriptional regulator with XRE-family HTH domain
VALDGAGHHGPARKTELRALLLRYRERRGWTQDDLAARVGDRVTRSAIAHYETGRTLNPSIAILARIKAALGIPDDEWNAALWTDAQEMAPTPVAAARAARLSSEPSRRRLSRALAADREWLDDADRSMLQDLRELVPALKRLVSDGGRTGA